MFGEHDYLAELVSRIDRSQLSSITDKKLQQLVDIWLSVAHEFSLADIDSYFLSKKFIVSGGFGGEFYSLPIRRYNELADMVLEEAGIVKSKEETRSKIGNLIADWERNVYATSEQASRWLSQIYSIQRRIIPSSLEEALNDAAASIALRRGRLSQGAESNIRKWYETIIKPLPTHEHITSYLASLYDDKTSVSQLEAIDFDDLLADIIRSCTTIKCSAEQRRYVTASVLKSELLRMQPELDRTFYLAFLKQETSRWHPPEKTENASQPNEIEYPKRLAKHFYGSLASETGRQRIASASSSWILFKENKIPDMHLIERCLSKEQANVSQCQFFGSSPRLPAKQPGHSHIETAI